MCEDAIMINIASCSGILGRLYVSAPDQAESAAIIQSFKDFEFSQDWPFGSEEEIADAQALLRRGAAASARDLVDEYNRQFIGPFHFEAPAWGSVYLDPDNVIRGSSMIDLNYWMREHAIESNFEGNAPADHIGRMLILLGWLAQNKSELVPEYLAEHLMPWAPRYLDLLEESSKQEFFKGLAVLTRATLSGIVEALGVDIARKHLYR